MLIFYGICGEDLCQLPIDMFNNACSNVTGEKFIDFTAKIRKFFLII